jgi:hypothetical protein
MPEILWTKTYSKYIVNIYHWIGNLSYLLYAKAKRDKDIDMVNVESSASQTYSSKRESIDYASFIFQYFKTHEEKIIYDNSKYIFNITEIVEMYDAMNNNQNKKLSLEMIQLLKKQETARHAYYLFVTCLYTLVFTNST